eukprot:7022013-Prymnesium_polylepis.1
MYDGCSYILTPTSWHGMPPENSGSTTSHGYHTVSHVGRTTAGVQSPGSAVSALYIPRVRVFPCESYRTEYLT